MAVKNDIYKGIWLDQQEAVIVTLTTKEYSLKRVYSEIENFHPTGGARSKAPWGPRDVVSESTYLNRKKHQLKQYFSHLILEIKEASELLILGPAEAKTGLLKAIENSSHLKFNRVVSATSDKLTDNQLVSKVLGHFKR